ncbi:DMT family transporter [Streptomyces sp. NPDC101166]|uniref:DMT family transporter n=1 Tax=Streptomyces sp. NPDC101166 TaxID=3366120 RepID=UPI0038117403
MSALALSVLLSLVSAVAYAAGAIVQERVAESSPAEQYAPLRRPGWWAAVALNGSGGLLHVVALAYGPLSLVQPLGALTIVVALPMAALFVGRKAGATAWRGAIMATVGLAGLLSLVGAADAQSLNTAQRVGAAVVTGGAVAALTAAGRAAHRHPAVRSMLLATGAGVAFGMSSVFTKTVAVDWSDGVSAGDVPSLAVIGALATAGMLLSQASYRGAGLAAPLATLTVVNPVVAAAVGITMFGETFRYGSMGTVLALGCGVVAAGGLILLTTERLAAEQQEAAPVGVPGAVDGARSVGTAVPGPRAVEAAVPGPRAVEAAVPRSQGSRGVSAVPPPGTRRPIPVAAPGTREPVAVAAFVPAQASLAEPVAGLVPAQAVREPVAAFVPVQAEVPEPIPVAAFVSAQASLAEPVAAFVPGPAVPEPVAVGASDGSGPAGLPPLYGPFYGDTYVSTSLGTLVLDRHRVRVKN